MPRGRISTSRARTCTAVLFGFLAPTPQLATSEGFKVFAKNGVNQVGLLHVLKFNKQEWQRSLQHFYPLSLGFLTNPVGEANP